MTGVLPGCLCCIVSGYELVTTCCSWMEHNVRLKPIAVDTAATVTSRNPCCCSICMCATLYSCGGRVVGGTPPVSCRREHQDEQITQIHPDSQCARCDFFVDYPRSVDYPRTVCLTDMTRSMKRPFLQPPPQGWCPICKSAVTMSHTVLAVGLPHTTPVERYYAVCEGLCCWLLAVTKARIQIGVDDLVHDLTAC